MMKSKIGAAIGSVVLACAVAASGVSTAAPNPAAKPAPAVTKAQLCAARGTNWEFGPKTLKTKSGSKTVTNCHLKKPKPGPLCKDKVTPTGAVAKGMVVTKTLKSGKRAKVCLHVLPKPPKKHCRIGQKVNASGVCAKAP